MFKKYLYLLLGHSHYILLPCLKTYLFIVLKKDVVFWFKTRSNKSYIIMYNIKKINMFKHKGLFS
jgi:hypothetical protein